jgi:gentisate 1,2-dioxygenase
MAKYEPKKEVYLKAGDQLRSIHSKAYRFLQRWHEKLGLKPLPRKWLFVRGLTSRSYSLRRELKRLRKVPRVIKAKDIKLKIGPQYFNANILSPKNGTSQVLYAHYVVLAPGGRSQKHGHMNEAMFYILDGKGYDIHDGTRYDWEAGDVVVVNNACVHQHFNVDPFRPARAIIIKSKPLYLFMNMVMQEDVERQPATPVPGQDYYEPEYFPLERNRGQDNAV